MFRFIVVIWSFVVCPLAVNAVSCPTDGSGAVYTETLSGSGTTQTRTITTSGCANHFNNCTGKGGACGNPGHSATYTESTYQNRVYNIMAKPVLMSSYYNNSCQGGPIAVAINGVAIYNAAVTFNPCAYLNLNTQFSEWVSFDWCAGHAQGDGEYHYHFPPTCLMSALPNASLGHSPFLGWNLDGFPIYGPRGPFGIQMQQCAINPANAPYCTDPCGGLLMDLPWLDGFKYRYYTQGNVSDMKTLPIYPRPTDAYYPFTTACRRGCLLSDFKNGGCTGTSGVLSNYTASVTTGYTKAIGFSNSGSNGSSSTTCKTTSGSTCVFPFTYKGVTHTSCTTVEDTKAWCATKTDSSGNYVAGNYGYCTSTCTTEATCAATCKYNGVTLKGCTTTGDTKPWCCTSTDSSGNYQSGKWRYCTAGSDSVLTTTGAACTASCKYQGTVFYGCTTASSSKPWCCTQTATDGSYITNKWGYCA